MEPRERIEKWSAENGWPVREWVEKPDDGLTGILGRFEVDTDEYEDEGIYLDTSGVIEVSVVGAAQYGNERVHVGFVEDGMEGAIEIHGLDGFEPAD